MTLKTGDLWDEYGVCDLLLFCANSTLDSRDCLVMGAGSALGAKQRFPHLPATIGRYLIEEGVVGGDFLLWMPAPQPRQRPLGTVVGALQTKRSWKRPSSLRLIEMALGALQVFLETRTEPWRVAMPFPGIGPRTGQLRREDVLPLLECLPSNVTVFER